MCTWPVSYTHLRDLAHTYVDQLDLEHDGFTGQILCVVTVREGDEDLEFLACLVATMDELLSLIHISLKFEVLRKVGDAVGNIQTYQL